MLLRAAAIPKKANELKIAVIAIGAEEGVKRTPVDTGRARGGWRVKSGAPGTEPSEVIDKTGTGTIETAKFVAKTNAKVGVALSLYNNVPYIEKLDGGSSRQAPEGMTLFARIRMIERLGAGLGPLIEGDTK